MDTFRAFSATHALVLAAIALLTALAIRVRLRRAPAPQPAGPLERAVAIGYLAAWCTTYLWLLQAPLHDPAKTYPLQLCHWSAVCAALVLLGGWRPMRALVYFWGFALSTQALVTPALSEGPALYPFWFFWTTHGLIIGVAVYDLAARAYRPGLRDLGIALAATLGYALVMLPLNLAYGWNYGFIGPSTPEVRSIVDLLGPWPERLVLIALIVVCAMALLVAPWEIARRWRLRGARLAPPGAGA